VTFGAPVSSILLALLLKLGSQPVSTESSDKTASDAVRCGEKGLKRAVIMIWQRSELRVTPTRKRKRPD